MLAATPIVLTDQERQVLSRWAGAGAEEHRLVERARVILLAEEGISTREIARRLHTRAARVSKWRQRFAKERLEGLSDAPTLCQVPLINAIKY
jgi:transcriptional regulator